jgi:predicted metalloprotease
VNDDRRSPPPRPRRRTLIPIAPAVASQAAIVDRVPRWLLIVCAAMVVAGCSSSSGSDTASSTETPTTTATAPVTVRSADLARLTQVPVAPGSAPSSSGGDTHTFLEQVFENVQAMWQQEFQRAGITYRPARLTIFSGQVRTACGTHSAAVGPFYCPASFGVYLDTQFFAALSRGAGVRLGDFAQAYVVAHEVGHHVQVLLGIAQRRALADRHDPAGKNARSVRFELQADCFAGVWMHHAYKQDELTDADLRDALNAAAVAGDDFLRNAPGASRPPEEWTHGSSAQRQHWLKVGFREGKPAACDTFSGT